MADRFYKLEDEAFPRLPVAASTVAKINPGSDNREDPVEASYLEGKEQQAKSQSFLREQPMFALSFKDDLDNADDFIAAHRLSDMLVKINLDESASQKQASMLRLCSPQMGSVHSRPTELGTDLSTGLLTFAHFGQKENTDAKAQPLPATADKDNVQREGVDSDHFSGSNSSFLANEKLMSVDSISSDITDDDIDSENLPDDELELYFNKLVPPAMQRGRVEGQEIPVTGRPGATDNNSNPSSTEPEQYRHQFLDDYNQDDFQMPDVRLAATGMDSCPASDEDTEDELESARRNSNATRTRLLPSTSRQLVGESNRPSFRPGLEGAVLMMRLPVAAAVHLCLGLNRDDRLRDRSSTLQSRAMEEVGMEAVGVKKAEMTTTYDALRGLGVVGSSAIGEENDGKLNLQGHNRNSLFRHTEMGDRVGPVGIGEASSSSGASRGTQRLSSVNWSMVLDRQEALDAMESSQSRPAVDRLLDSAYLRSGAGLQRPQESASLTFSYLQGTQGSFHLSQVLLPECHDGDNEDDDGVDEPDGARHSLGLRGGPCGNVSVAEASDGTSEDDNTPLSTSLEPKYFSQSIHQDTEDSDDGWNYCPDNLEQEFKQGAHATQSVVYQNDEGQWVTDLAYYSSFEKEVDGKTSENVGHLQTEEFLPPSDALEKIAKDQETFEKEHQFMQEEKMEPASSNSTFNSDSSWKVPPNSNILMRASQPLAVLAADDLDFVKRPSFGYIITSPEKRDPFPLIHPSEFSARGNSLADTMEPSEADKTLNPEDLDQTLEAPVERMSLKDEIAPYEQEDPTVRAAPDHHGGSGSDSSLGNQSGASPNSNNSHLMLSISTIASAIADASISTDPSQLAAMIMALSKRSRAMNRPESADHVGPTVNLSEEPHSVEHILPEPDQSSLLDILHRSTCVGELSAFDMEKYLKMTEVSCSPDASVAHTTFDLTAWANNLSSSQRNPQGGVPEEQGSSAQQVDKGEDCRPAAAAAQQQHEGQSNFPAKNIMAAPLPGSSVEKHVGFSGQNNQHPLDPAPELLKGFAEPCVEETQYNFRPSTSPLTHSSPSQTSIPKADGMVSPDSSSGGLAGRHPGLDLSPQSTCSSPSLSRLTYISMNDGTVIPTPDRQKNNCTMALSSTIIRFSPTPPLDQDEQSAQDILGLPKSLDQVRPQHSKSLDPLPAQQSKSPEPSRSASGLSCTRSQSECNYHFPRDRPGDLSAGYGNHKHISESNVRQLTKVDSGYCSNLNIQQTNSSAPPSSQWGAASSMASSVYAGGLGMPSYTSGGLHYVPIPGFNPQCAGLIDPPHQGDIQSLLAGRSLFNSKLAQQYLGPEVPLHPSAYHVGATGHGLFSIPNTELTGRHVHPTSVPLGIPGSAGTHHLNRPHHGQQDAGMMGKPFSQYGVEPIGVGGLEDLRGQVVVPEELRFPHTCCVGIASQTSLSLFNPSERWQQVAITVTSLAIDGEKVDSLPFQWLIVKNKTIIAPKSTEEQKLLFIPPQAGVYQCVFSVCSWPASAETEVAARANIFAKRVVLVAIAENPALEVELNESGSLDFGDLSGGSARSLPLKLLNMTHATVPIRLVISANATAWRCFTFSKHPVTNTSEAKQQAGHMAAVSSPSVMNHVMHASYEQNPQGFMVWVHFKAPQKYTVTSGELGPADEYNGRVDIEVDSPGPSHVIRSVPLKAKCGTARVHAPKDLQTVSLSVPLGKSSQQTLPLKNAGNIDVQLKLKCSDAEEIFSVTPDELSLRMGEEQGIVVSFKAQGSRKYQESLLTILVLPSGPQYEVTLKGQVVPEDSGKAPSPSADVVVLAVANDVPPILSNKQFVAWGGVTLGRAVQQKLVLRNNSTDATQQLRLLIRGQDQDCFQLQSMFSPEERLTRHGELSIRPREDVTVHLLFAPTRVACMLAKLEIKQSGVRPSQPGVKFTIPLSGYGGTSNIILEDQRKQADGYVATLTDIAVGRVSKVCICVRNTGSRAAFIKAVAFSDVQTRSVMEPSVISIAPSQFVLKERTQEVITVLIKSTQREQALCQSANAMLATVCLFCGDEVSRQQYRRLLQSKPEAVKKALSENSLLKNINFYETFLGEENLTEVYDLPQRPNEAHIFYGNMSKVVVSLVGSTNTELLLPADKHRAETDSALTNGNVSLDVLPVKGPQGPALRVAEPTLKASEPLHRRSESWTLHPEQLVLAAPTINGAASTSQVQIRNNTSRELSFDLSWPAHCLTITPQHGIIEPQCHLQILISPNPSLATKSTLLPWSGKIYVQCDSQQKLIKVQIRGDLALDVSAAPADSTLSALPAQAATPVLTVPRLTVQPSLPQHTPQAPLALLEISNKTIIFPSTPSGETSEAQLEVQNGKVEVRWYLSSFAPPYVKGVDNTGDVYRATYTAFRCSGASGTLGAHEKMQVPITFLPRDRGDYAQFWDLECHPVSEPQQKTRTRFQLCGTTEATVKSRKRADASAGKTSQEEAVRRGVYSQQDLYTFPVTRVGESSTLKVNIRNNSSDTHELKFVNPMEPFHIKHSKYSLRSQHYLKLPVQFKPSTAGTEAGVLLIQSETSGRLVIQLTGEASP
ncbi:Centrosomal protein of 192 kDa [Dissostichus eleginoides]|uniref:Centrosomal protein of 192 kDa n=1 Tax=Dissostichus eleginoides TaxID=100907 RepID=A0AAD9FB55_DISEL|nr:Centrosomal protein of 192 kDa [Dissostichus eleginoides]